MYSWGTQRVPDSREHSPRGVGERHRARTLPIGRELASSHGVDAGNVVVQLIAMAMPMADADVEDSLPVLKKPGNAKRCLGNRSWVKSLPTALLIKTSRS